MTTKTQSSITGKERWAISAMTAGGVITYYNHNVNTNSITQNMVLAVGVLIMLVFAVYFKKQA